MTGGGVVGVGSVGVVGGGGVVGVGSVGVVGGGGVVGVGSVGAVGGGGVVGVGSAGVVGGGVVGVGSAGVVGLGVDLVDIDRFRTVLCRRLRMVDRLFTPTERAYAERAADPAVRFAVRFAAKEAALKALGLGLGGMRMNEIEVVRLESGRPVLVLHGGAASTAAAHGVGGWLVSLSHTDRLAQAAVVALAG